MTVGALSCQPGLPPVLAAAKMGPMTDKKKDRDQRLAAALRENLQRRKAQARELAPGKEEKDCSS